ncbi:hypothetical protein B0H10DRAFT_1777949 [Mycena sp. CBHHK59/15]|nr:hypothetical protein B0H10DRAFT_1777949 [Mycena sp. CBHHK59/15]
MRPYTNSGYYGRDTVFPPRLLTEAQTYRVISKHCKTMHPSSFVESGCAVRGCLVARRLLTPLSKFEGSLALLIHPGVTRKERFSSSDPIEELEGPVLAEGCTSICVNCEMYLNNSVIPRTSLVHHNWIEAVPEQLWDLTYAEGIMIARVRHNWCVVRVNSGHHG